MLPSSDAGATTEEVGFFAAEAPVVADWLATALEWRQKRPGWDGLADAAQALVPNVPWSRTAVVPVGSWSVMFSNGPGGTDTALLPSSAAEELGCVAVRAVCVPNDAMWPARILHVYGPEGEPRMNMVRIIRMMNDSGRWEFYTDGSPLPFERLDAYQACKKRERFTQDMLYEYLRELGLPYDAPPQWNDAILIKKPWTRTRPSHVGKSDEHQAALARLRSAETS